MSTLPLHGETAALWGGVARVSPEDVPMLSRFRWWVQVSNGGPYAYTWARDSEGRYLRPQRKVYMHRLIADTPPGRETDHRNRDTLDNRRENLRNVSPRNHFEVERARDADEDADYAAYLEEQQARAAG